MDLEFQQSYVDETQKLLALGSKKIKVDKNFKYVIENGYKADLVFIKDVKFGDYRLDYSLACRDIEKHSIFRVNDFNDFVVIRKFVNNKFILDRIDYLNVEYRLINKE
jgi:hypothetical protein